MHDARTSGELAETLSLIDAGIEVRPHRESAGSEIEPLDRVRERAVKAVRSDVKRDRERTFAELGVRAG